MLRLRDLLTKDRPFDIEYRCNAPKCDDEDDMLFGACSWNGKKLISEDGDNYYLSDVIEKYMWNEEEYPYYLQELTSAHFPEPYGNCPQANGS